MVGGAKAPLAVFGLLVLLHPAAAEELTGNPLAGRKVARLCSVCHGIDGIAKVPEAANLAGQNPAYLARQLQAFRSGERKNETMSVLAPTLSDTQIADVAAYYGAIQIAVTKVPGQSP